LNWVRRMIGRKTARHGKSIPPAIARLAGLKTIIITGTKLVARG